MASIYPTWERSDITGMSVQNIYIYTTLKISHNKNNILDDINKIIPTSFQRSLAILDF